MTDVCNDCRSYNGHCGGRGTFSVMEQDGRETYMCTCFCGSEFREDNAARHALSDLVRRYGVGRLIRLLTEWNK